MIDTTRTFPRGLREAFREHTESALGIDGPVIPLYRPWWVRLLRRLLNT